MGRGTEHSEGDDPWASCHISNTDTGQGGKQVREEERVRVSSLTFRTLSRAWTLTLMYSR